VGSAASRGRNAGPGWGTGTSPRCLRKQGSSGDMGATLEWSWGHKPGVRGPVQRPKLNPGLWEWMDWTEGRDEVGSRQRSGMESWDQGSEGVGVKKRYLGGVSSTFHMPGTEPWHNLCHKPGQPVLTQEPNFVP
jgi:hypothetical protein